MKKVFPVYKGSGPYIFVSYSHRDSAMVWQEMEWLEKQGFSFWYDSGIEAGKKWRDVLAEAITGARVVLYFITPNSVKSPHCIREVNFALDHKIPVLAVHLRQTELPSGLELSLSDIQAILKYEDRDSHYRDKLNTTLCKHLDTAIRRSVAPARRLNRFLGALAAAVVVTAAASLAYVTSQQQSIETDPALLFEPAEPSDYSIAVLPFTDMSPNGDQRYMSDGIAEELINSLTRIPELRVAARTSAFSLADSNQTIPEIAKLLGVNYVLEGSIRKSEDQLRITAQLIEASTDAHVWSESYTRYLGDIFQIQDDIAEAVVSNLEVSLLRPGIIQQTVVDPQVYELYLQARYLANQSTPESTSRSFQLLDQVIELDPGYAPALVDMAGEMVFRGSATINERRRLINQALTYNPDYAPAIAALGYLSGLDGEFATSIQLINRAFSLSPKDPVVVREAQALFLTLGRAEEGVKLREYVVARDPLNVAAHVDLGIAYFMANQFEKAIETSEKALFLSENARIARATIALSLLGQGMPEIALREVENEPWEIMRMLASVMIYHDLGQEQASTRLMDGLIEKYGEIAAYYVAWPLAYRGDNDRAFEYLQKAADAGSTYLVGILSNPGFTNLYGDPRWGRFLESINRSPDLIQQVSFNVNLPDF